MRNEPDYERLALPAPEGFAELLDDPKSLATAGVQNDLAALAKALSDDDEANLIAACDAIIAGVNSEMLWDITSSISASVEGKSGLSNVFAVYDDYFLVRRVPNVSRETAGNLLLLAFATTAKIGLQGPMSKCLSPVERGVLREAFFTLLQYFQLIGQK